MVLQFRKAGDRDRADAAASAYEDWEGTTVCREQGQVEPRVVVEGSTVDPELLADTKRRAAVAVDDGAFAREPSVVVGRGAGKSRVESR